MKVLIVAAGEVKDTEKVKNKLPLNDYTLVISVDGGYDICEKMSIKPQYLIGDLDSTKKVDFDCEVIKFDKDKDYTDLDLAIEFALKQKATFIDIIGATGNRLDHFLGNLAVLERLHDSNVKGRIIDEKNIINISSSKITYKNISDYVSVLPITDSVIFSCFDLKYEVMMCETKRQQTLGISNESSSTEFTIEIHRGKAFIIQSDN